MRLMWDSNVAYTKEIKKYNINWNPWKGEAAWENLEQIKA
jgi:hypothetical protein